MSRAAVRAEFEKRFTVERMARAYVSAYRSLLARASAPTDIATSAMPLAVRAKLGSAAWDQPPLHGADSLGRRASG